MMGNGNYSKSQGVKPMAGGGASGGADGGSRGGSSRMYPKSSPMPGPPSTSNPSFNPQKVMCTDKYVGGVGPGAAADSPAEARAEGDM